MFTYTHVLVGACALLSLLHLTRQQDWVIADSGCITPDGGIGDCIEIHDCEPIINVLNLHVKRMKPVSGRTKNILAKYVCAYGETPKVCCPRVYKTPTTPKTTTSDPIVFKTPRLNKTPRPVSATTENPVINSTISSNPSPLPVTEDPVTVGSVTEPEDLKNLSIRGRNLLPQDTCGLFESENKVAEGQAASLYEFPWMALLAYETRNGVEYLCGGTLINKRYILTAAHCLLNTTAQKLTYIRLGELDLRNETDCDDPIQGDPSCLGPTEDIAPENVIIHPNFNFTTFHNDIALIRLQRNVEIKDHIRPICLPLTTELQSATLKTVVLTGWGLTENRTRSDILLKADVAMKTLDECRRIYKRGFVRIIDEQMCVGGLTRKGSCTGDSGGPIQVLQIINSDVKYVQYGVLSLGFTTCGEEFPGIHTNVVSYIDWIINNVRP